MSDYLSIPLLLAVFIIIPAAVIYSLRGVTWVYRRVSGKQQDLDSIKEKERAEYLEPDWASYKKYLLRSPSSEMVLLYECSNISINPIIEVGGEEYYLYPIHNRNISDGFWHIGQKSLGVSIILKPSET